MPPAIIGGAIAGIGAIGGAVLGSSAQKKAAKSADASQQAATDAQLQLGRESMALNKDIYNSNYDVLSPYASRGNVAGNQINALLGLGTAPTMTSPLATAAGGAGQPAGGVQTNPVAGQVPVSGTGPLGGYGYQSPVHAIIGGMSHLQNGGNSAFLRRNPQFINGQEPVPNNIPAAGTPPASTPPPATPGPTAQQQATSAFNDFANSAGMQFQLQQGENAINNGYAAKGQLQSGAALKGLQNYGQQTALNNYFMPYMSLLGGQQATGAGAASSIAGVGANFGNTAANINAGMGQSIQSGANAASNAALLKGQANSNMWSGIGSALGGLGSSFGGF